MRQRRLKEQGSPALKVAVRAGLISTYRAGEIAKLPLHEQERAVTQWSNRSLRRTRGEQLAARVIRRELRKSRIDLGGILSTIREAVCYVKL